jgi:hypothetical protein
MEGLTDTYGSTLLLGRPNKTDYGVQLPQLLGTACWPITTANLTV